MRQQFCIECRWIDLRIDFNRGSHYFCVKRRKPLTSAVLHRKVCKEFARVLPQEHWGP